MQRWMVILKLMRETLAQNAILPTSEEINYARSQLEYVLCFTVENTCSASLKVRLYKPYVTLSCCTQRADQDRKVGNTDSAHLYCDFLEFRSQLWLFYTAGVMTQRSSLLTTADASADPNFPFFDAVSLRDDLRAYLPEILPRFTSLFQEAEREGNYQMVQPALDALEAIGPTLEDHLQLLLPALVRLVPPGKMQVPSQGVHKYH